MKRGLFIFIVCTCLSCEYIQTRKSKKTEKPIASVYEAKLYGSDINHLLPITISKQDSSVLVKSIINSWATKQLLLQKAEENSSQVNNDEIEELVKDYRESLFINGYKERLIRQQLDTVISDKEIEEYYQEHKENFKLNEELLQADYIHLGNDYLDKREAIRQFMYNKEKGIEKLSNQTINFKSYRLGDSTWIPYNDLMLKIPIFQSIPKEKLLKISKYFRKENSLGVYLVAVKGVLRRNDIAPVNYVTPKIKQIILHKRKLELIREIEKTLIHDAIQNQNFKEY